MPIRQMRRFRKQKHLSIEEVAQRIDVHPNTISNWEKLSTTPKASQTLELASIYGHSISELMKIVEDEGD